MVKELLTEYKKLSEKIKSLENDLYYFKNQKNKLQKQIKNKCFHENITHYRHKTYDRTENIYTCNICGFDVDLWKNEFDYKNIKNIKDL